MFGYVIADLTSLSDEQKIRYRGCYCGLCRMIGSEYGTLQRLTLNYDLTFLALLLSALYEPSEAVSSGRCIAHPFHTHQFWQSEATSYAAVMNLALTYFKCLDDWKDDKKLSARTMAVMLKHDIKKISCSFPRQLEAIRSYLDQLSELEAQNCQEPDKCANIFGRLMGELFVWKNDRWAPSLRAMGEALGRFIYLMDAVLDLPNDIKDGKYNPLCSRNNRSSIREDFFPILKMMIGECCNYFEQLPVLQDLDLLRNILYSGIWTRYYNQITKEQNHV